MFSHVMVGSNDIERSKLFYDAVLAVLGAGEPLGTRTVLDKFACSTGTMATRSASVSR